jgi:hypothetical protein
MRLLVLAGIAILVVSTSCKPRTYNGAQTKDIQAQRFDRKPGSYDDREVKNLQVSSFEFLKAQFSFERDFDMTKWTKSTVQGKQHISLKLSATKKGSIECDLLPEPHGDAQYGCKISFNTDSTPVLASPVANIPCKDHDKPVEGSEHCWGTTGWNTMKVLDANNQAVYVNAITFTGEEAETLMKASFFGIHSSEGNGTVTIDSQGHMSQLKESTRIDSHENDTVTCYEGFKEGKSIGKECRISVENAKERND